MRNFILTILLLLPVAAQAQITEATDVLKSEIDAVLHSPEGGIDRQVKVVDIGQLNVAVGVLHRGRLEGGEPARAIAHAQVTEVYYIVSGSGTLVTGGEIDEPVPFPEDSEVVDILVGPTTIGNFEGGRERTVSVGDVIVIPAGVLHGWSEIPDHVTYLSVRPDPDRVLPAGYVNPAL